MLDIPKAMSARTYGADGRLLFGVTENHFADADGTYELSVEGGAATCRPSSADPEITLTAQALGAAYLGGQPLGPLVSAGLVDATSEAAAKADRFLRGSRIPWCQEVL